MTDHFDEKKNHIDPSEHPNREKHPTWEPPDFKEIEIMSGTESNSFGGGSDGTFFS